MSFLLEDNSPKRKTREACLTETPDELKAKLTVLLQSPELLLWIITGIEAVGVAGEQKLALILYLTGTSRLLSSPLAVFVQGPSSSGKSYVIEKVATLFPEETVLSSTDITPNALYYLPQGALEHRFVVAGERSRNPRDESSQTTKALREIISAGTLSKLVTGTDLDGPQTQHVTQQGPIAFVESTTAPVIYEEDANRCLILQPDERPEQTRKILAAAGKRHAGHQPDADRETLLAEFHCLQRLLEPREVVIPYAERLFALLPEEPIEIRRTLGKVGSMIQTCALLFQYQRSRNDAGRIIAQPEDYWLTRLLLEEVLARSLGKKSPDSLKRFVTRLRNCSGEQTAKKLNQLTRISVRTINEHLQRLLELGAVEQIRPHRGQSPALWLIKHDMQLPEQNHALLPSVADVCGIDEDRLPLPELPADWASADRSEVPF